MISWCLLDQWLDLFPESEYANENQLTNVKVTNYDCKHYLKSHFHAIGFLSHKSIEQPHFGSINGKKYRKIDA